MLAFAFLTIPGTTVAQSLPDSIVQQVRAGTTSIVIPGDSVVVPLVGTPTLPLIEVFVNGVGPYRLLIDLGSNVTLLRRDVVDASRSVVLVDRPSSDIVLIDTLRVGEATLEKVTIASYDDLDVDGVLGYNVLQNSSFTFDMQHRRLVLHRRSLPAPDGTSIFPYQVHGRLPYIYVSLGKDSLLLNLDTGATEVMTIPVQMQSHLRWVTPPKPGRSVFNNQTGRIQVLEGHLIDTLRFGELEIKSPLVYVNPDAEDAWLGAGALINTVWVFDPKQQRVQVTSFK
ncbi:MAG: hypothetical protein ACRDGA_03365 [Bacteroidota bacterium]